MNRDYDEAPAPKIVFFNSGQTLLQLRDEIMKHQTSPRLVIHGVPTQIQSEHLQILTKRITQWANHSVGWYSESYEMVLSTHSLLPSLKNLDRSMVFVSDVLNGVRSCNGIFGPLKGNRSCFDVCD
jgi:hypothetical protein